MVVFLCGGCDCMWCWLYVVVEAVHGGDGHLCVATRNDNASRLVASPFGSATISCKIFIIIIR